MLLCYFATVALTCIKIKRKPKTKIFWVSKCFLHVSSFFRALNFDQEIVFTKKFSLYKQKQFIQTEILLYTFFKLRLISSNSYVYIWNIFSCGRNSWFSCEWFVRGYWFWWICRFKVFVTSGIVFT